ncbi:abortive infection system antitoxin AbiGi family protein [Croceimicrobium hydrocarbonivorans]|uniref:Uncharacterized protein n=1 Tax=Croceimicrobium hydrocarbonivorans TaxID=2761580 RepID=A0A7H0VEY0_9FLAO|nr:abortive infection system antitoxin AbiGi family protein [Croceimicrobium hydrocarbonivorans]QNR24278.1 hypothetical protein H4K34_00125 [Croceimicrobium hydrocarbonivorans]
MAISTNSIIHYTNTFNKLRSIISTQGFRISYCREKVNTRGGQNYSFGIPMVSFCDIPITDYKKNFYYKKGEKLGYYGDYGIGLHKNWASSNGLNPVIYIDYNSFAGTGLRKSLDYFNDLDRSRSEYKSFELNELIQIALHAKNYQGELIINDKLIEKRYKFYDEREWRYVPKSKEIKNYPLLVNISDYDTNKDNLNEIISDCYLKFNLDDISYIILNTTQELDNIVDLLHEKTAGNDFLFKKIVTKLFTNEQIMSDF